MALTKLFQRYTFTDAHLNAVLQDYRRKMNDVIDYFLDTDFGELALYDTDQSDILSLKWNENDSNPRTLNLKVNNADRTISMSGNLTVEGASLINSDLTTDANWATSGSITATSFIIGANTLNTSEWAFLDGQDQAVKIASNVQFGELTLDNDGLHLLDTGGDHDLIISPGSDLGADRVLTLTTGDAARTITLSGNPTLNDWFDQAVKQASTPTFGACTLGTGTTIGNLTLANGSITNSGSSITFGSENLDTSGYIALKSNAELRFYDNGNYVGFEAPALGADCMWVLPAVDGAAGEHMVSDGSKNLSWTTGAGTGDVSAAANIADHAIVRGNGGAKGVQTSVGIITDGGILFLNDTANTFMTKGLTIDQSTNDDELFAGKSSSDVVHGMTTLAETDTYVNIKKQGTNSGGVAITGLSSDITAFQGTAYYSVDNTTKSTAGLAPVLFYVAKKDGTTRGNMGADANAFAIRCRVGSAWATKWIVDEDGDTWQDGNINLEGDRDIRASTRLALLAGASGVSSATIYGDTTVTAADLHIDNDPWTILHVTSSKKSKDKIEDLELDSSLIYNIRPVSYNSLCKNDDKAKRFHGLVAEDIEKVLPEIIDYDDNNEARNYDTTMLMTLMLTEEQKLRQELDILKEEISELKNK